jgi:hypothetical protein
MAAWPTTVTRSRCARAFARSTQKPLSGLWKVTRSTRPARTSWVDDCDIGFMRAQDLLFLFARHSADAAQGVYGLIWAALLNGAYWRCRHAYQVEVHDLGAPLSPCLSRRSSSMSASAVISASSSAPRRSSRSLLSSSSRSHIEVSDLMAPGKSCANRTCVQMYRSAA